MIPTLLALSVIGVCAITAVITNFVARHFDEIQFSATRWKLKRMRSRAELGRSLNAIAIMVLIIVAVAMIQLYLNPNALTVVCIVANVVAILIQIVPMRRLSRFLNDTEAAV